MPLRDLFRGSRQPEDDDGDVAAEPAPDRAPPSSPSGSTDARARPTPQPPAQRPPGGQTPFGGPPSGAPPPGAGATDATTATRPDEQPGGDAGDGTDAEHDADPGTEQRVDQRQDHASDPTAGADGATAHDENEGTPDAGRPRGGADAAETGRRSGRGEADGAAPHDETDGAVPHDATDGAAARDEVDGAAAHDRTDGAAPHGGTDGGAVDHDATDEDASVPAVRPDVPVDLGAVDDEDHGRAVRRAVSRALAEDLGDRGDLTSYATVPVGARGVAVLEARQDGVVAGLDCVSEVVRQVDGRIDVELLVDDGARVTPGDHVARLTGPLRTLLTAERTLLNLVCQLSGVATHTAAFVEAVAGTDCVVRDTRKTTPGLRLLEKRAVRAAGGANHRVGLYDALLVKDNHVTAAGGVGAAARAALEGAPDGLHVQVEVTSPAEVEEALAAGVTDLLLDNFSPDQLGAAVEAIAGRAAVEASGGITLETARAYAEAGADRLAVGALTHSAPALDLALEVRHVDETSILGGGRTAAQASTGPGDGAAAEDDRDGPVDQPGPPVGAPVARPAGHGGSAPSGVAPGPHVDAGRTSDGGASGRDGVAAEGGTGAGADGAGADGDGDGGGAVADGDDDPGGAVADGGDGAGDGSSGGTRGAGSDGRDPGRDDGGRDAPVQQAHDAGADPGTDGHAAADPGVGSGWLAGADVGPFADDADTHDADRTARGTAAHEATHDDGSIHPGSGAVAGDARVTGETTHGGSADTGEATHGSAETGEATHGGSADTGVDAEADDVEGAGAAAADDAGAGAGDTPTATGTPGVGNDVDDMDDVDHADGAEDAEDPGGDGSRAAATPQDHSGGWSDTSQDDPQWRTPGGWG